MATETNDIRDQVVAQCMAVASMANSLALIHNDHAVSFAQGAWPTILESKGKATAALMEVLGDILNNMDAVTDDDARFDPVFEAAQERWPHPYCAHCGRAASGEGVRRPPPPEPITHTPGAQPDGE